MTLKTYSRAWQVPPAAVATTTHHCRQTWDPSPRTVAWTLCYFLQLCISVHFFYNNVGPPRPMHSLPFVTRPSSKINPWPALWLHESWEAGLSGSHLHIWQSSMVASISQGQNKTLSQCFIWTVRERHTYGLARATLTINQCDCHWLPIRSINQIKDIFWLNSLIVQGITAWL